MKKALREITAARKQKAQDAPERDKLPEPGKQKDAPAVSKHKQPKQGKSKPKKGKGAR